MGYVGISFAVTERKNEEETATKTALGKFLRHCRDSTMKSLTKLLPSGGRGVESFSNEAIEIPNLESI